MLIHKKKAREFIKANGRHITRIQPELFIVLNKRIEHILSCAIANNASRKTLTSHELVGGR